VTIRCSKTHRNHQSSTVRSVCFPPTYRKCSCICVEHTRLQILYAGNGIFGKSVDETDGCFASVGDFCLLSLAAVEIVVQKNTSSAMLQGSATQCTFNMAALTVSYRIGHCHHTHTTTILNANSLRILPNGRQENGCYGSGDDAVHRHT